MAAASTEARRADLLDLDLRSSDEIVAVLNDADREVAEAVGRARREIAAAVDAVVERLARGGRLVYVGAGSAGRIAALDAAECPATFGVAPDRVVAVTAGGGVSDPGADAAAEDDAEAGAAELAALGVDEADVVVLVSASGRTPYVLGALGAARAARARTIAVVGNEGSPLAAAADLDVTVVVGPEVVAGSTRLKAGTAQKLVLNSISTAAMVRLGRTYGGLMVHVLAANDKLRARARAVVAEAAVVSDAVAERALEAADGEAATALVALLLDVDAETARARLAAADGDVRRAAGGRP